MTNVHLPASAGQRTRAPASVPVPSPSSNGDPPDRADLHRALLDLRASLDDADAVARDMLRPPRERELGPRIHARNYTEAHRKMDEMITYLLHSTAPPSAPSSAPSSVDKSLPH